ncbi:MAG: ComEC/Rec2 family competence protein, partial [Gemmataceae bacterium]|nr:ComEC/Rec2 family competence protein [Gemmataceae bacterium]
MTAPNIRHPPPVRDLVWESPLVPVAVAVTLGILIDRNRLVPVFAQWMGLAVAIGVAACCFARWPGATMPALWVCSGWAGALYHHADRHAYPADDIGWLAAAEPRLVRLRGWVVEEPTHFRLPQRQIFLPYPRAQPSRSILRVHQVQIGDDWQAASGKVQLSAEGSLDDIRVGDEVEVFGWMQAPHGPVNPGGFDWREHLADQRIRAVIRVRQTSATVVRLEEGWRRDFWGRLAWVRAWGRSICEQNLPDPAAGLAIALILGDSSAMMHEEWEKYILTGVLHVLAISGQHLVILGALMGWGLRQVGVRRRPAALGVALLLMGYALLTGFRPPVQRAAIASVV